MDLTPTLRLLMVLDVPIDDGQGSPMVLLHGYAMGPATYGGLTRLLAERCRVVVPDLFAIEGEWRYQKVLDAFASTLDRHGLDQVSLLGHSFGGGIELGFASRFPDRVIELVFSDTLAASREWRLADEALRHPGGFLRLATPTATSAFLRCWVRHPRQLVGAAWWGFTSDRGADAKTVAASGIPAHVMWANRDSILARSDGEQFARELGGSFTVAAAPDGRPIDHDWMFQQPALFMDHLNLLGLKALSS
jgi:pimeloyl-ACP methyl ester carboxylesterase